MSDNNFDLGNLVVLVIDKDRNPERFGRIARVTGISENAYRVKYTDDVEEELSEGFKVFQRFCMPEKNDGIIAEGRDLVSLRKEFMALNDLQDSYFFCRDYGMLFRS